MILVYFWFLSPLSRANRLSIAQANPVGGFTDFVWQTRIILEIFRKKLSARRGIRLNLARRFK